MGSAITPRPTRNSWRNPTVMAKISLVHRFTQVLLNPSKEASKARVGDATEDDESDPALASKLTPRQWQRRTLEMDVERLQEKLQQETELHSALENAITQAAGAFSTFPRNLPIEAQHLLADVAMLEVAVSNLEEQMVGLEMQIQYERNERLRNAACLTAASPLLPRTRGSRQGRTEDHACEARDLTGTLSSNDRMAEASMESLCQDDILQSNYSQPCTSASEITSFRQEDVASAQSSNSFTDECTISCARHSCIEIDVEDNTNGFASHHECVTDVVQSDLSHTALRNKNSLVDDGGASSSSDSSIQNKLDKLWRQPNKLSQEMVSCMIGIYCHLSDPLEGGRHIISDNVPSPSSPFGHVTSASFSSLSDLSSLSFARSPQSESKVKDRQDSQCSTMDPYKTHDKLEWGDIGRYSSAVEVSWMSVGKEQLEYAADALRIFRSLVEQLSRVDATSLSHDEKLAFWINIYNALMMHAYLAYGVPKNDVKYFALMQKAAYTVGGHFFNAMAIEHVLLRGKAPSYRPQIALLLALHKVKIPDGASKFAISRPEPLVLFALSCGAWSSPAVRIYSPDNVQAQLQAALHDYVRASVGVDRLGKVLVPKLLHCYARDLNMLRTKEEASEGRVFVLWLSSFLPNHQANLVRDAVQKHGRRMSPRKSTMILVQPFSFRLRYLFLHQADQGK